jgi:plasmid stabilization system protein ParE
MQLRWTEEAANDLERIADYLLLHTPVEIHRSGELIE